MAYMVTNLAISDAAPVDVTDVTIHEISSLGTSSQHTVSTTVTTDITIEIGDSGNPVPAQTLSAGEACNINASKVTKITFTVPSGSGTVSLGGN